MKTCQELGILTGKREKMEETNKMEGKQTMERGKKKVNVNLLTIHLRALKYTWLFVGLIYEILCKHGPETSSCSSSISLRASVYR